MSLTAGELIRTKRLEKKLKMEDVAKALNIGLSHVSRFEKDTRTPQDKHIKILSKLLDIPEHELHTLVLSAFIIKLHGKNPHIIPSLEMAKGGILLLNEKKKSKK